jgi:hypothetical protein
VTPFLLAQAGGVSVAFGLLGPVIVPDAVFDARPAVCAHMTVTSRLAGFDIPAATFRMSCSRWRDGQTQVWSESFDMTVHSHGSRLTWMPAPVLGHLSVRAIDEQWCETMVPAVANVSLPAGLGEVLMSVHSAQPEATVTHVDTLLVVDAAERC